MSQLARRCRREVDELHEFFEGWLSGTLKPGTFGRVEAALAREFSMVGPDGIRRAREPLLGRIRRGRGSRPDLRIRIRDVRVVFSGEDRCLLTYEEWQDAPDMSAGRISTALFRREEKAPAGVVWVHLHETWIPEE